MMTQLLDHYLQAKRAAGYKMESAERILRRYVLQAEALGETHVRTKTVLAWAGGSPTPERREVLLGYAHRFAKWLAAEDPAHEVPSSGVFAPGRVPRKIRKIYSQEDITRIMEAASKLGNRYPLRPQAYRTLFGLLAATGLRISEALNLTFADITADGLIIRETKFRKSRLVPLHDSVRAALDQYLVHRRKVSPTIPFVFVSSQNKPWAYNTVLQTFLGIIRDLGMRSPTGGTGPRLHDFRHTFAVRSLEQAPQTGRDVSAHILALSTYLGHTCVAHTFWYLQSTPQLMDGIADACEHLMMEDES